MRPRSLVVRYAAGLAFAYLLTSAEVITIVVSVSDEAVIGAQAVLSVKNLIATVAIVAVGTISVTVGGIALVALALHRRDADREPGATLPRKPLNVTRRQSVILLTPWTVAAVVMIPLNIGGGLRVTTLITSSILFGATATVCTGFLFTQRALRSLMVARLADRAKDFDGRVLCSGGAIDRADEAERRCWARGRRDVAWSVAAHADLDAITTTPLTLASLVAPRVTYMAQTGTHLYVVAHSGQHDRSTRGYPGR
jgi:hypothetical protein